MLWNVGGLSRIMSGNLYHRHALPTSFLRLRYETGEKKLREATERYTMP